MSEQQATPKRHFAGTHRSVDPSETLKRANAIASKMGVTRIANITGLDTIGMPVVAVYRPNARSLAVSQGKGLDLTSATVSGLMEAIESYHAEHVALPLRLCSYTELRSERKVVDVSGLPRLDAGNFHDHRPLLWIEARDCASDQAVWVPFELVHTNFTLPLPTGSGAFLMSSNGLASGNHRIEALSHAICEVVERDSMALWSIRGGMSLTDCRVALDSVADPDCQRLLLMLEAAEIGVAIWDATSDIGLPTFACVIVDREDNPFRRLYASAGSGCHPVREIALARAITEAAQCRLTYISGTRDDGDRTFFEQARATDRIDYVRRQVLTRVPSARSFGAVPSHVTPSFEQDLDVELACLSRAGLSQVLSVDLTLPGIDLPVVRVIVPGLESLHNVPGYLAGKRAAGASPRASA